MKLLIANYSFRHTRHVIITKVTCHRHAHITEQSFVLPIIIHTNNGLTRCIKSQKCWMYWVNTNFEHRNIKFLFLTANQIIDIESYTYRYKYLILEVYRCAILRYSPHRTLWARNNQWIYHLMMSTPIALQTFQCCTYDALGYSNKWLYLALSFLKYFFVTCMIVS